MNHDMAIIAAVIDTQDMITPIKLGVTESLLSDEAGLCWTLLLEHFERFQAVPSLELFSSMYPGYEHVPTSDPIPALVNEVRIRNLGNSIDTLLEQVASANESDPDVAFDNLLKLVEKLSVKHGKSEGSHLAGTELQEVMGVLRRIRDGGGLLGLPWPWEYLNQNTTGVVEGNVFYFYGREKSRKTMLLFWLAIFYWSMGLKVLFFLRDTPLAELKWRLYPMACGFDISDFNKGLVLDNPEAVRAMEEFAADLEESGRFIFAEQEGGITGYRAKVQEYNPDVIFHDYPKGIADDEMEGAKNPAENQYVARMIDRIKTDAVKHKKRVFLAGHANREGVKGKGKDSSEMAWSDHIARRVDGAFRVIQDDYADRMAIFVTAGRSMQQKVGFTISSKLYDRFGIFISDDYSWVHEFEKDREDEEKAKAKAAKPEGEAVPKQDLTAIKNRFRRK